jgi:hypothetical protein
MVHIKNKKLLDIFEKFIEANFTILMEDDNGRIALSDYIECLQEHRALEILRSKFKVTPSAEDAATRVNKILEKKSMNNSLDQFWMYQYWSQIPEESKKVLVEELKENLELLLDTKINGILLYCKIFDFVELKDKTKMLKRCIAKKLESLVKRNSNVLFLLVKIANSYDDSGNIGNILYNDIISNFIGFIENQATVTFLFYVLCEDFEKEFSVKYHPK